MTAIVKIAFVCGDFVCGWLHDADRKEEKTK